MRMSLANFTNVTLSRGEMKRVTGGWCFAQTKSGGVTGKLSDTGSKAYAIAYAKANGTHWCCDSCNSASWF